MGFIKTVLLLLALMTSTLTGTISFADNRTASALSWLQEQDTKTCLAKSLLQTFSLRLPSTENLPSPIFDTILFNQRAHQPQAQQIDIELDERRQAQPFHDVRVYTKNTEYEIRYRKFSTQIKGEELRFRFDLKTCTPKEIIATCLGAVPGALDQKFVTTVLTTTGDCPSPLSEDTCIGVKRYCSWFKKERL
jgi:hypothetical protein